MCDCEDHDNGNCGGGSYAGDNVDVFWGFFKVCEADVSSVSLARYSRERCGKKSNLAVIPTTHSVTETMFSGTVFSVNLYLEIDDTEQRRQR